jgi:hypothetical protein
VSGRAMWGLSFSNILCNVMHVSTAWTIIQLAQSTYKSFDWRWRNAFSLGMCPDYCVCCMSSTSCKTPLVWSFELSKHRNARKQFRMCGRDIILQAYYRFMESMICFPRHVRWHLYGHLTRQTTGAKHLKYVYIEISMSFCWVYIEMWSW